MPVILVLHKTQSYFYVVHCSFCTVYFSFLLEIFNIQLFFVLVCFFNRKYHYFLLLQEVNNTLERKIYSKTFMPSILSTHLVPQTFLTLCFKNSEQCSSISSLRQFLGRTDNLKNIFDFLNISHQVFDTFSTRGYYSKIQKMTGTTCVKCFWI